jgi:tetratricopeptide (TPR) repeat protein
MTTKDAYYQKAADRAEYMVESFSSSYVDEFKTITRRYALFHIIFFTLAILELCAFVLFFSFLTKTTIFAFTLASTFLTGFTYFVLLFYFQAKKPQQLLDLKNRFVENCQASLPHQKGEAEYHAAQTHAFSHFLSLLHRQEYTYYSLPSYFQTLAPLFKKFSVWTHWKDLHLMKELLLLMIAREHVALIKLNPTDLNAHAELASTYRHLSLLYMDPRKATPEEEHLFVSNEYYEKEMLEKFKRASHRAIEELQILASFAPNDAWVHLQLAAIYRDLEMPKEEMHHYEILLSATPHDADALFRLGVLCFLHGRTARALSLYEQLKKINSSQAEELISYYDASLVEEGLLI